MLRAFWNYCHWSTWKTRNKLIFIIFLGILYFAIDFIPISEPDENVIASGPDENVITKMKDEWQWVVANDSSGWLFEQSSFVRTSPDSYSVTIKTHYSEDYNKQETERLKLAKPISYRLSTYVFNFATKQMQLASSVIYDENENVLYSVDKPGGWSKINPKTVGEAMFDSTYKYFQKNSGKVKSPPGTVKS